MCSSDLILLLNHQGSPRAILNDSVAVLPVFLCGGIDVNTGAASCEFRRVPLFLIADGFVADRTIEDGVIESFYGFVRLR